jgi:lysophospholipase L1-like esterase
MGRVSRGFLMLALVLVLVLPAVAKASIFLSADATGEKGWVRLGILGSMSLTDVHVGELVNGEYEEISPLTLDYFGTYEGYGDLGRATIAHAARWRCDRLERQFLSYGTTPEGVREESDFLVRTPSCENRMRLSVPLRAERDRPVKVVLTDTFQVGAVGGRLCRKPPKGPARCKLFRVPTGATKATTTFVPPREGYWHVSLRSPDQRIERTLAVGVKPRAKDLDALPDILATGDSLMQGLDAVLEDRLTGEATVDTDVHIGTGLTKPLLVDWAKLPARQVKKYHPKATLLFLGVNDGQTIKNAQGTYVACCGQDWIDEYTLRARRAMKTYIQGGKGLIYWLAIPASRDDRRTQLISAVNHAIAAAAKGIKNARILDMVALFTPNGVYRESMMYHGRRVTVRQSDGIHLSNEGAEIAADYVISELEKDGVLAK